MTANSEVGTIEPVAEIAAALPGPRRPRPHRRRGRGGQRSRSTSRPSASTP
ncbi:MAG: hypothetical protein M0C28_42890 [Candidatus Moduliflexus flocculans]|nr:hypothetical protein [Candidatus Moduliflexus flocculans]